MEEKVEKSKTSQRIKYEAEAKVLSHRFGGLEGARAKLGLSQRKMAQLLFVDPSAWTRWAQSEANHSGELAAPPHVYRSLAWFLSLQEKFPALDSAFWLRDVARVAVNTASQSGSASELQELRHEVLELQKRVETLNAVQSRRSIWGKRAILLLPSLPIAFLLGWIIGSRLG